MKFMKGILTFYRMQHKIVGFYIFRHKLLITTLVATVAEAVTAQVSILTIHV